MHVEEPAKGAECVEREEEILPEKQHITEKAGRSGEADRDSAGPWSLRNHPAPAWLCQWFW